MDTAAHSPLSQLPLRGSRRTGDASPAGTVDLPSAVPAAGGGCAPPSSAARVLETLRSAIAGIERPSLQAPGTRAHFSSRDEMPWRLGCVAADALLPDGLDTGSLHEIKGQAQAQGASAAAWMASLGFALRLAALRLEATRRSGRPATLLWCWPRRLASELGHLSGRGLVHLGIDPSRLVIVETAREAESLMALEEGLKSGKLAIALGVLDAASLNAARRLSLAANARRTPCLIATHPAREVAAGCATRWRIGRMASAPHPFDVRAPGACRFSVALERCRARSQSVDLPPLLLEWCDETLRFRLAAELAADTAGARRAQCGA